MKKKKRSTNAVKLNKSKDALKLAQRHFQKKNVPVKSEALTTKPKSIAKAPLPKGNKRMIVMGVLLLAVIGAGGGYWWYTSPNTESKNDEKPGEFTKLKINDGNSPGPAPEGMVWIPGGWFWMGEEPAEIGKLLRNKKMTPNDTAPIHKVYVNGYWMDKTEVTNAQWAKFAKETGYLTVAERKPRREDFKAILAAASKEQLPKLEEQLKYPFSIVFFQPEPRQYSLEQHLGWWKPVRGANWKHPEGPESHIRGRENYPVVHIAYEDALAYCEWAKKRLPTEAEWEFAARGGLHRKIYCWGDEILPEARIQGPRILAGAIGHGCALGGFQPIHGISAALHSPEYKWYMNIWQGKFPEYNSELDGFAGAAPVASYPPNKYGLYDMAGNVWEWCSDWYRVDYYENSPAKNPHGPASGFDPAEPGVVKRVQRGGSYLCADNYCIRYLAAARGKGEPTSSQSHAGFRCVMDAK